MINFLKTFRNNIQKNNAQKKYRSTDKSQSQHVLSSLIVAFVVILFITTGAMIIYWINYYKPLFTIYDPYVITAFYGAFFGFLITNKVNSDFINSTQKKSTIVDALSFYITNSKNKFSEKIINNLNEYYSEINNEKRTSLLKEICKDIDLEISLKENENLNQNQKFTYLKVIGVLTDIITTKGYYSDQKSIIEEISDHYKGGSSIEEERGLSERNLNSIFGEANKLFKKIGNRKAG